MAGGVVRAAERLRPHLHALAAFAYESGGVAARTREPLAGEMRLAWWREALSGARPAEAAGAPVAAALIDTMAKFALPLAAFESLLQALTVRRLRRDDGERRRAGGVRRRHRRRADRRLARRCLPRGARSPPPRRRATRRARGWRWRAPCSISPPVGAKPLLVPRDVAASGAAYRLPRRAPAAAATACAAALAELAAAAAARFDEAEARLAALPVALAPAFAPLATARLDLRRWRRAAAAPFTPAAPWRRQLALWLWARRR